MTTADCDVLAMMFTTMLRQAKCTVHSGVAGFTVTVGGLQKDTGCGKAIEKRSRLDESWRRIERQPRHSIEKLTIAVTDDPERYSQ